MLNKFKNLLAILLAIAQTSPKDKKKLDAKSRELDESLGEIKTFHGDSEVSESAGEIRKLAEVLKTSSLGSGSEAGSGGEEQESETGRAATEAFKEAVELGSGGAGRRRA